ncbi:uncharacterized protein M6B38_411125 [Iris pallida]|uniref:Uncharacterized protein n=1 Tax=Iris pallida TaxID=29817 RepID=A0AAX6DMV9_IRIPA|nr:Uncharacterized protein M6B38_112745 [Iris pallida]KAJ6817618.1 uncharacterized protein M6B38_411125 [Iris pallida]
MRNQRRKVLLLGFATALLLGTAVYFRLWSIDSSFTSDDREILRKQFERANMEAMDESAEWRMKYDGEADKTRQCQEELSKLELDATSYRHVQDQLLSLQLIKQLEVKGALANASERLSALRKDNLGLQKQVETTTQNCNCDRTTTQH